MEQAYCLNCEQPLHEIGLLQPEVRPRRRPKSQLQCCPSCHCCLEVPKHSSGKTKYTSYLACPANQRTNHEESLVRVMCGHGTTNPYHHSRKRQTSAHRPQRRSEEEQIFLAENVDGCCVHPPFAENGHFHDDWQDFKTLAEEFKKRKESRSSRQRRRNELEDEYTRCRQKPGLEDLGRGKLGLDLSWHDGAHIAETVADDLEDGRMQKKFYNGTKVGLEVEPHGYAKERFPHSQTVLTVEHKPRKRSTVRKHTICRPDDELTNRDESTCEEEEQDQDAGKNIYGGGDLNLRSTKNVIVGLIDKALSQTFGSSTDQQKNGGSTAAKEDSFVEAVRVLQGDCCESLKDLPSYRGVKQDYIKDLKSLRWKRMNHIQKMFSKLCVLQKFLDSCSPRLQMPAPQTHAAALEQRVEDRQQQPHEEKQHRRSRSRG